MLLKLRELLRSDTMLDSISSMDGLTAHAALCFEQPEDDDVAATSGPPLSDLLYSYRSLDCVLQLNHAASTSAAVLVGEVHHITRAALHHHQSIMRRCLLAWTRLVTEKNDSDDEDGSPLVSHRKELGSSEGATRTRRGANAPSQLIPERSLSKAYSRTESSL